MEVNVNDNCDKEEIINSINEVNEMFPVHIYKKNNETTKQFEFRKKIYDKIFNDIKNEEKALIYSNMWVNMLSLGCTYPKDILKTIEKYRPSDEDNIYLQINKIK
jgi:hypothetical protein